MLENASPAAAGVRWRIALGSPDADVVVVSGSNDQLRWLPATAEEEGCWEAIGGRPCFRLDPRALPKPLPAGWYELRCGFEVLDGDLTLPSLYPRYANHSALTGAELTLPKPDADGGITTLVLLLGEVDALEFYPSICPARFRLQDLVLRRVSRLHALAQMLVGGRAPARTLAWGRDALRRGRRRATDRLYVDYRRRMCPQGISEYDVWCRKYDSFGELALSTFHRRARELADTGPLISVLLPVYDTPERWLRRCLDSVLEQAWEKWELCVVDDASPMPHVAAVLDEYARRDPRIRVARRERNGHISEASNTALAMARGGFIALLDHDDELRPHALLRNVEALAAHPGLAIIYSDEDKLDADGRRFDPNFKPDWNPDLLRSQNYVCHLSVIDAALVREVGGFRAGFEGSQDHDLVLRCSERVAADQIHHVAEILYHWRAIEGSTALSRNSKDYASVAGARAVAEHLERAGSGAEVVATDRPPGMYRVRWPLPSPAPKISLIIPTRDRVDLLCTCVESILDKSTYPDFELVVVDNQSSDPGALAYLSEIDSRERVRVLRYDAPFNYSAINNWAVAQCDGELVGLVNNDIEVISPDWLQELAGFAVRADTGAVGAMLYYPDDTIQHAGVVLGVNGVASHVYGGLPRGYHGHAARALVAQNLSAVTGACMLLRRALFDAVGGLDERLAVAFNDIDFCLRIRELGYRNVWTPFAELYHHESASRGSDESDARRACFAAEVAFMLERWGDALLDDPAYNPNLSLQDRNFELAFPPRARSNPASLPDGAAPGV